jgi:hypothetical protein
VKFTVKPHAIVSWTPLTVIEDSPAADLTLLELALIIGAIGKQQLSPSVFASTQVLALINSTLLVSTLKKFNSLQTASHLPGLHFILFLKETFFAFLETLEPVSKGKLTKCVVSRNLSGVREGLGGAGRGEFEVANGVEY